MPTPPSVAVLVPLYQTALSLAERASLSQCLRVLGDYPILLVKPQGLDVTSIVNAFPLLRTQSFPDHFFTGTDSYNQLLTSPDFYQRFIEYDYVLIHQLDAYVFRDELPYWCAQKLDYIGAPTVHQEAFDALPAGAEHEFAHTLTTHRIVFNGGLSLRRVRGLIRYLNIYRRFYPAWRGNEDMLFSLEATRLIPMKLFIRLPTWQQALRFSFEKSPAASYELTHHALPFGCHAWERYAPEFWQEFIKI
ncbi:hypothetical protein GBK04_13130 [Cytophagaceae bacterium SJW1-29]|uniref:DUF5672 domain-containing protein n=2 Tax=Salmonirosea aquatica TaxID=2654236 RepID=A0A7C9FRY8_9BACT|nr:hypothetical protein [Cytophagaceae bacterium SJW1-29]